VDGGDAGDGLGAVDAHVVTLDAAQLLQRGLGRQGAAGQPQALAHHPVQHQRHEADAGVRADALGQPVEHRRNLDLGLQHMEATLDVGQALVARHDLLGAQVMHVAHQQQLAVHRLCARLGDVVDVVGEQLGLQVHPDDVGQVRLAHLVEEARLGAAVRQLAPALALAGVLFVELAGQCLGAHLQRRDAITSALGEIGGLLRVVRHHQAMALPAQLVDHLGG